MEKRIKEIINGVAIETDEGFLIRDMDIVAKRIAEEFQKEKLGVEFISYDGAYPNLCCGTLILKINGAVRTFHNSRVLNSGGSAGFINSEPCVTTGAWTIGELPEDLEPFREEIEKCINENIPHGCCGGCL